MMRQKTGHRVKLIKPDTIDGGTLTAPMATGFSTAQRRFWHFLALSIMLDLGISVGCSNGKANNANVANVYDHMTMPCCKKGQADLLKSKQKLNLLLGSFGKVHFTKGLHSIDKCMARLAANLSLLFRRHHSPCAQRVLCTHFRGNEP